ncbi:MAG: anti-sigma factor [Bacteroidota bacterium]
MIPEKEQFEELCSAYALGALEEEERSLFEEGLKNGGDEYRKIFEESVGVSYLLNTSVKKVAPSPLVKARLLKKIHKKDKQSFSFPLSFEQIALSLGFGNPRYGFIISLLMLIVVAEIGTYAYLMYEDAEQRENQLAAYETKLMDQQRRFVALQTELQQKEAILNVLQSPKIEMVLMSGQQVNPAGYGKIIWDPARKVAVLHVSKLPAVPSDKDYQLWYLDKNKKPVSAGVFAVTAGDENYFKVSEVPLPDSKKDISAFAITIESKGGVPQPTGAMYLLGTPNVN